jgi:hypothetical protein
MKLNGDKMLDEKCIKEIKTAVKETLNEEVKAFYVDRETHWEDHQFLGGFRRWIDDTKSTAWRAIIGAVVVGAIGLLVLGFAVWGGKR